MRACGSPCKNCMKSGLRHIHSPIWCTRASNPRTKNDSKKLLRGSLRESFASHHLSSLLAARASRQSAPRCAPLRLTARATRQSAPRCGRKRAPVPACTAQLFYRQHAAALVAAKTSIPCSAIRGARASRMCSLSAARVPNTLVHLDPRPCLLCRCGHSGRQQPLPKRHLAISTDIWIGIPSFGLSAPTTMCSVAVAGHDYDLQSHKEFRKEPRKLHNFASIAGHRVL